MATLKDVAKRVGVSTATVSYVLSGRRSISAEVKKKVLAAIKELDYQPNRKAQGLRTGQSNLIGMLLPDLTKPYFPNLAQQVEYAARKAGFAVLLIDCQTDKREQEDGFNVLSQQAVDGIIWFPLDDSIPKSFGKVKCPVVLIDTTLPGYDTVKCDFNRGGHLQVEEALKYGHQRIGLLSGPQSIESARDRRNAVLEAMKGKLELAWEVEVPFHTDLNDKAIKALKKQTATAVICADDLVAIGAIKALKNLGLSVPGDVSVIGFDDIPWSTLVEPMVTTVAQPISAIGSEAVSMLIQKIQTPDKPTRTVILDVGFTHRESTAEVK
ncbi:LacI family transcriptional regulator [Pseudomaricurvus alkylphenolicus]|jgi:LacI family transcriptional regulator|uniref:LacI family DNA-binding transcriptional regulator n=1 Tax=Pseudomaricurvus alkylphenolicus TaxID=1306991 RepID=UPI001423917D|nr:LacI family DNA-binding transcriptional regulator [Pseudomaricurvus alkylphenolicus]NIB42401.1 LacI family transcriptional regulator [Pseudomaricurvus alkylphenolicus]